MPAWYITKSTKSSSHLKAFIQEASTSTILVQQIISYAMSMIVKDILSCIDVRIALKRLQHRPAVLEQQ